jgi:5-methylcytosine-specific restriction protein A
LRVERRPKLADDAKKWHGTVCKVCGFDFSRTYGEIGLGYIEAHHLTPVSDLRGRPRNLNPRRDFTVVCANCHRMLHRHHPPLTVEELAGHTTGV